MINDLRQLLLALDEHWLEQAQPDMATVKVRVRGDYGRYIIEKVTVSKDDGAIVLWLDERGDPGDA